jgi:hypothetical protein
MRFVLIILAMGFSLGSSAQNENIYSKVKNLETGLEFLYYASVYGDIAKIWPIGNQAVGIRFRNESHYDLVLFNKNRLVVDSLRLLEVFNPEGAQASPSNFVSIQEIFVVSENNLIVLHNFGLTLLEINEKSFKVLKKKISFSGDNSKEFQFSTPNYVISYNSSLKKKKHKESYNIKSIDNQLNFDSENDKNMKSQIPLNLFWDLNNYLEIPSKDFYFRHFIVPTNTSLLLNVPRTNHFKIIGENGIKHFFLPVPDINCQSWFVFYDQKMKAYLPVMHYGDEYVIFRTTDDFATLNAIAKTKEKPLAIHDFKVYLRSSVKESKKSSYFEHHLVPLY